MALVIGDSHARIIATGQETLPADDPAKAHRVFMLAVGRGFLKRFSVETPNGVRFRGGRKQEFLLSNAGIEDLTPSNSPLFLSLGFHGVYFFHSKLWNDYTIAEGVTDRQFLSQSAFKLMATRFNFHILSFLDQLKAKGIKPVIVAAPPLPARFVAQPKVGSMDTAELLMLETAYRKTFSAALRRRKIDIIAPPEAALEDGRLAARLIRSDDQYEYHGNADYGVMVLRQIEDYLANN
ncbi:hypothetical protein [Yoonia sp. 208BN28-4]|uniref:hypothetical protein n=1 Tax=Yoonia sp. 208BN28-4 TaxID=3126505 RepID=UPI0030B4CB7C